MDNRENDYEYEHPIDELSKLLNQLLETEEVPFDENGQPDILALLEGKAKPIFDKFKAKHSFTPTPEFAMKAYKITKAMEEIVRISNLETPHVTFSNSLGVGMNATHIFFEFPIWECLDFKKSNGTYELFENACKLSDAVRFNKTDDNTIVLEFYVKDSHTVLKK